MVSRLVLTAVTVVAATACVRPVFHGDGVVRDDGVFEYPRFHVALHPAMSLDRDGRYSFEFRGLPDREMSAVFRFVGITREADVRARDTTLAVTVVSVTDRRHVCGFEANTKTATVTGSGGRDSQALYFWSPDCLDVHFSPGQTYAMTVVVAAKGPEPSRPLDVEVVWQGGGIELP
jgi:hypothetical protein